MESHKILIKMLRTHRKLAHKEFCRIGLTEGQPRILDFLVMHDGCIQKDIADSCKIEPATVTSVLGSMEKKELIYRSQNSENRRILNVFITEKGIEAQKQVTKVFNDLDDLCFKGFSDSEKKEAIKIFTRIQNNLDEGEKDNA